MSTLLSIQLNNKPPLLHFGLIFLSILSFWLSAKLTLCFWLCVNCKTGTPLIVCRCCLKNPSKQTPPSGNGASEVRQNILDDLYKVWRAFRFTFSPSSCQLNVIIIIVNIVIVILATDIKSEDKGCQKDRQTQKVLIFVTHITKKGSVSLQNWGNFVTWLKTKAVRIDHYK